MATVRLENVSFNKLKEFTSLGSKKNTTIKGKFTLLGEYELITKDGGDDMTTKEMLKQIIMRLDNLENLVHTVIKVNNLKTK